MISSRYDYNPNHFHFARHHSGAAPEPARPISGWGRRAGPILLTIAVVWLLAWAVAYG